MLLWLRWSKRQLEILEISVRIREEAPNGSVSSEAERWSFKPVDGISKLPGLSNAVFVVSCRPPWGDPLPVRPRLAASRPYLLMDRKSDSQSGNRGSIPRGATKYFSLKGDTSRE